MFVASRRPLFLRVPASTNLLNVGDRVASGVTGITLRSSVGFPTVGVSPRKHSSSSKPVNNVIASAASSTPVVPEPRKSFAQNFVEGLPPAVRPYAYLLRMDKPGGTWLLFIPCAWSVTMAAAAAGAPLGLTAYTLALMGVGSFVMRGGGCIINDICDIKFDRAVERTKTRPLAAGDISVNQAVGLMAGTGLAGLGVLAALPHEIFILACCSLPLVMTYPLFKRVTYYPQVVLSTCFTWGALLGFPAMGMWNIPAMLCLHASTFSWCMIYDTIYAHQDKKDDVIAGVKSTALKWGDDSKKYMSALAVAQVALFGLSGFFAGMGPVFYGGAGLLAYRLFTMIKKVDLDTPSDCWKWFNSNKLTGFYIWLTMAGDYAGKLLGFW